MTRLGLQPGLGALLSPLALVGLFAVLVWSSCSEPPQADGTRACVDSRDCPGGQLCSCTGVCVTPAPCESDSDCCANEVCDAGRCAERNECAGDLDCGGGTVCAACACVAPGCSTSDECPAGESCEGGVCLASASIPCGGCESGEACDPLLDRCVAAPAACAELSCGPGEVPLVSGHAARLGPVCSSEIACTCAIARPASGFRYGAVFSATLLDIDAIGILAHEHRYDDLLYVELDRAGNERARVWVDGVPTGPVVADPTGPRGGVSDAGFAMGAAPSAAFRDRRVGVAYRDDTNRTLRFAESSDRRSWTASRVDGAGDVGEHSALAAVSANAWGIAYSAVEGDRSELRWAYAVDDAVGETTSFATQVVASSGFAEGTPPRQAGSYPSVFVRDGVVYIAWYDGFAGALMLSWGPPTGPFATVVLDPGTTRSEIEGAADVGRHAQLMTDASGALAVAYLDHIAGTLLFATIDLSDPAAPSLAATPEVAAPGRQDQPPHLIGADLFAARGVNGAPMLVYQDSSAGDLVLARRVEGGWERSVLAREGAAGFSPHLFVTANGTLALDGVIEAGEGGLSERLSLRLIPF